MILGFALAILFLIACSATVSATETAITAASQQTIEAKARTGNRPAIRVAELLTDRENTIGALLLANNVFNILGAALATDLFLKLVGEAGVAVATLVMTVMLVIFAEVLPKTYAIRDPEAFSLKVALPASLLVKAVSPISYVLGRIVRAVLRILSVDNAAMAATTPAQQLRMTLAGLRGDRRLGSRQRQMLKGVLDLEKARIDSVMTHRSQICSFDVDNTAGELASALATVRHSRLPLWQGEADNIVGVIHARDLIGVPPTTPLDRLMRRPWYVPNTASLQAQLDAFIAKRTHLALVVDEYSDLKGLITLEDIVEEITGEIDDETDRASPQFVHDAQGDARVPGHISVGEVNRLMDWDLPLDRAGTLAGLLAETTFGSLEPGSIVEIAGHRAEILAMASQQPASIRLLADPDPIEAQPDWPPTKS